MTGKVYIWDGVIKLTSFQGEWVERTLELMEVTDFIRDRSPFALGLDGETWMGELPALAVPIPNTDKHVLVCRTQDACYTILGTDSQIYSDCLIMAAAMVLDFIASYHAG